MNQNSQDVRVKALQAADILEQVDAAELDIDRTVSGETGELRIGVRCLFCYMWLPRVLKIFQEKFPNVNIDIRNARDPDQDLISEKIDIAVSASDSFDLRVEAARLFEDEVVVVMSEDDCNRAKPHMGLSDFHGADIISLIEKSKHYFFYGLLQNQQIEPRRYMTISHPEAMVDLIASGLGLGILPKWFASPYMKSKNLVTCPLTAKGTWLTWKASWLKARQVTPFQREFTRIMANQSLSQTGNCSFLSLRQMNDDPGRRITRPGFSPEMSVGPGHKDHGLAFPNPLINISHDPCHWV